MKNENKTNLQAAIDHSINYHETADVAYVGEIEDLLVDLDGLHDGDIDYCEYQAGKIDVWGWTDATPENQQDWRLTVTLNV